MIFPDSTFHSSCRKNMERTRTRISIRSGSNRGAIFLWLTQSVYHQNDVQVIIFREMCQNIWLSLQWCHGSEITQSTHLFKHWLPRCACVTDSKTCWPSFPRAPSHWHGGNVYCAPCALTRMQLRVKSTRGNTWNASAYDHKQAAIIWGVSM